MTLYLVRHADAGGRDPGSPADHLRELSEDGERQAARIAERLAHAGVTRVLSSPYPRCVRTVAPLARRAGVEVEPLRVLAEGGDGRGVVALMLSLAAVDAVLCSHGDVIPHVLELLEGSGTAVEENGGNAKGSIWTITSDGESLLAASYAKTPRTPRSNPR